MALFKILKKLLSLLINIIFVYLFFFIFLFWPNDKRIKNGKLQSIKLSQKTIFFDFIKNLDKAIISVPNLKYLQEYKSFNQRLNYLHTNKYNAHISYGTYPLKIIHSNSIVAIAPSKYIWLVPIPENASLKFGYGIGYNGVNKKVNFKITVTTDKHIKIFEDVLISKKRFPFQYNNPFYKNFIQYLDVNIPKGLGKVRNAEIRFKEISLKEFKNKKVKISFETYGDSLIASWITPIICIPQKEKKYNVILLIIDTLRADYVFPQLSPDFTTTLKKITPNIKKFKSSAISFPKTYANGNLTKPSTISLFCMQPGHKLGNFVMEYVTTAESKEEFYSKKNLTAPLLFKKEGYLTSAIGMCSLYADGMLFGADIGFDHLFVLEKFAYSTIHNNQIAREWLNVFGDIPFFLLVYYPGPHGPYRPPFYYIFKNLGKVRSVWEHLYKGEVNFTDKVLGEFFEFLEKSGFFTNTVIALTSDHGDTFKTYKNEIKTHIFHDHGVNLHDDEINVPLIIKTPQPLNYEFSKPVQLIDLPQTLLELTKSKSPLETIEKKFNSDTFYLYGRHNKGIRYKNKYKYIFHFSKYIKRNKLPFEFPQEELYDLEKDPFEIQNIIHQENDIASRLRNLSFLDMPEKVIYKFSFKNAVIGKIKLSSKIKKIDFDGHLNFFNNKEIEIQSNSKNAKLTFQTQPPLTDIDFNFYVDGKPVTPSDIRVGKNNLRLLTKNSISKNELIYFEGFDPNYGSESVKFGYDISYRQMFPKVKIPPLLKTVLLEWGYLQEPKKE